MFIASILRPIYTKIFYVSPKDAQYDCREIEKILYNLMSEVNIYYSNC